MQYLTFQIVLTERKPAKSNDRFFSIVKSNKLSKVRRKKWLAQNFRKDLTERKLERTRTRIKIIISASPSSAFYTKFTISDLKSKSV